MGFYRLFIGSVWKWSLIVAQICEWQSINLHLHTPFLSLSHFSVFIKYRVSLSISFTFFFLFCWVIICYCCTYVIIEQTLQLKWMKLFLLLFIFYEKLNKFCKIFIVMTLYQFFSSKLTLIQWLFISIGLECPALHIDYRCRVLKQKLVSENRTCFSWGTSAKCIYRLASLP